MPELLARTVATAGRAVLVSGLAVGAALAGLFAFAEPLLAAMALGGALVVCLATIAGLTLVPALIAVAHRAFPSPGKSSGKSSGKSRRESGKATALLARLAAFAQRRPVPVALGVTAGLVLLSLPLLQVTLANSDARSLPTGSEERRTYEAVERDFAKWTTQPVTVLIEANAAEPAGGRPPRPAERTDRRGRARPALRPAGRGHRRGPATGRAGRRRAGANGSCGSCGPWTRRCRSWSPGPPRS